MKQYNLNTKYGRKKAREQAAQNYANMTPEQQAQHDSDGCLVMAIIIGIIAIIIFAAGGGSMDLMKWLSR
jgi:thiamine pyrophosphokinase